MELVVNEVQMMPVEDHELEGIEGGSPWIWLFRLFMATAGATRAY